MAAPAFAGVKRSFAEMAADHAALAVPSLRGNTFNRNSHSWDRDGHTQLRSQERQRKPSSDKPTDVDCAYAPFPVDLRRRTSCLMYKIHRLCGNLAIC
jgi:hypothetical protein